MCVCSVQIISHLDNQSKFQMFYTIFRPPCECITDQVYGGYTLVRNIPTNIFGLKKRTDLKLKEVTSLLISYNKAISLTIIP